MNSTECNSGLTSALFKENEHTIIQILLSTSAITIVIPNSLQVAIIIKTSQIRTTSTYLALNLALCDLSMAIFGLVPSSYILTNRMPCIFEVILNMVRGFFLSLSKCLVALISYDRYLHIKSPTCYSEIFTTRKLRILQSLCLSAAIFMTALSCINYNIIEFSPPILLHLPVMIIITTVIYYYVKSIKLLNEHRQRNTSISQNDNNIVKLARYIVLIFGFFHFTSISVMVVNRATNTRYKHVVSILGAHIALYYSPINAICFLCVNRASKRFLKKFQRCFKASTVSNVENESAATGACSGK